MAPEKPGKRMDFFYFVATLMLFCSVVWNQIQHRTRLRRSCSCILLN